MTKMEMIPSQLAYDELEDFSFPSIERGETSEAFRLVINIIRRSSDPYDTPGSWILAVGVILLICTLCNSTLNGLSPGCSVGENKWSIREKNRHEWDVLRKPKACVPRNEFVSGGRGGKGNRGGTTSVIFSSILFSCFLSQHAVWSFPLTRHTLQLSRSSYTP